MLLIIKGRYVVKVLDDNKLSLVLVVHEITIKSGSHAVGHLVIHAIVKTVERGINDKDVWIEFGIGRQIFPQHHYHHGVQIRMIALAVARSLVFTVDLNIKGIEIEVRLNKPGITALLQSAVSELGHRGGEIIPEVILGMILQFLIAFLFVFKSGQVVSEVGGIGLDQGNLAGNSEIGLISIDGILLFVFLRTQFRLYFGGILSRKSTN